MTILDIQLARASPSLAGEFLATRHETLEDLIRVVGRLHIEELLHVLWSVALYNLLVVPGVRHHALQQVALAIKINYLLISEIGYSHVPVKKTSALSERLH